MQLILECSINIKFGKWKAMLTEHVFFCSYGKALRGIATSILLGLFPHLFVVGVIMYALIDGKRMTARALIPSGKVLFNCWRHCKHFVQSAMSNMSLQSWQHVGKQCIYYFQSYSYGNSYGPVSDYDLHLVLGWDARSQLAVQISILYY